ncbi:MAG TPA: hypothetical protein VE288_13265 [Rubrobacteraceae bacterium]|nr:hypothetical protein [Rubrobacteraceae bacterium]
MGTVLVEMNEKYTLRNREIESKPEWAPFDERRPKRRSVMALLGGDVVAEDGKVDGKPGGECLQLGNPGRILCYMGEG